ncbi:hypothetical protein ACIPQA_33720 [Streptomyces sp. NPDC090109]|uniref:hypothetical protein n=1 Tax=Streptomyces sp. NPDC090109 TaxID=3365948 RepID=UPI003815E57E
MADLWMPEAEHYDLGDPAPTDSKFPPKAIAHITWDKNASEAKPQAHVSFGRLLAYFTGAGRASAPHILWDPFTGQLAQFYPANSRSKSVADKAGGTRTNRAGKVVLQIEAVFFPHTIYDGKAYAQLIDTPCKGWAELHRWVKSHGVPDVWPMGRPTSFTSHRSEETWAKKGGWYAHAHVPENDHTDPGSWPAFKRTVTPAKPKPKPKPTPAAPPFPGRHFFVLGAKNVHALKLQKWLHAGKWGPAYTVGPSDVMTQKDIQKVAALQAHYLRELGPADGLCGPLTWKYAYEVATGVRRR